MLSILEQNLDHSDFVYIGMKLKEWRVLNSRAVMFDTLYSILKLVVLGF